MARKSQWAQFAENFESTYGIVSKVKQAYDTKQVMNDEKFMGAATDDKKAGAGFGLSGDALEKARYKALGDIATKYGDSAGGLANRTALADLNAKDRNNRIDANNEQYTTALQGLLAQNAALADINNTKSRTGLNNVNTDRIRDLTPLEIKKYEADIGGLNAETARLTLTQDSAVKRANVENDLAAQTADGAIKNLDLSIQADREEFKVRIQQAFTAGNLAQQGELESQAFLDYTTRFQDGEFATPKDATRAYINTVAMFNPNKARDMVTKYTEDEIAAIANDGLKIQSEVSSLLQTPGPDGLNNVKAYFDDKNGDDVGVQLEIDPETGAVRMFETDAEGTNIGDLFTAANETEARSQIQSIATYGNATAYAEQLFSRTVNQAGLDKTNAEITQIKGATTVLGAQAEQLASELKVDIAQIEKIEAEITKINKTVENSDQKASEEVREEGLQRFLGGDTYAYLQADNPEAAKTLLQTFKYQTGMLGEREAASHEYQNGMLNMAALNEGGVSLEQYLNMSPADRAQFER
jgi:hypothetical protein